MFFRRLLVIRQKIEHRRFIFVADGHVDGSAPQFQVASVDNSISGFTRVQGTFTVPCYLVTCGASATAGFHYSTTAPDATPTQIPGNTAAAPFECMIPSSASSSTPARLSLYGHGLLGSHGEVEAGNVLAFVNADARPHQIYSNDCAELSSTVLNPGETYAVAIGVGPKVCHFQDLLAPLSTGYFGTLRVRDEQEERRLATQD